MKRILQTPKEVTSIAMSLLNSFVLLLLFSSTSFGQPVLIDRTATNTVKCDDQTKYGVWLNFRGLENHYTITDGEFIEYDDGTAKFSGIIINNRDRSIKFIIRATLSNRTHTKPHDSPKRNMCYKASIADWYYYTSTRGYLIGLDYAAGAKIYFNRMGPSFQVGTGANVTDSENFGACGWLNLYIHRQPYSRLHLSGKNGDINIRLDGSSLPRECDNLTRGGKIGNYETACEPFDPTPIENLESPSGGNDAPIQFMWLKTTDPSLPIRHWMPIAGANDSSYDPGSITETTYYLRCSRRLGCLDYDGESNIIAKIVNGDDQALACGMDDKEQISGAASMISYNSGVDYATNLIGDADGKVAKFHDENDYIVVKLDDELEAGQQYTISWKYRNYTSGYPNADYANLQVFESIDGTTFTLNTTLQTNNKRFLVHQSITAATNTRYLKLANGTQTPDFQVDAVSYCNSVCKSNNTKACVLQNFGTDPGTSGERLIWLKLNNDEVFRYQVDESTAQFIEYPNGTAVLIGTAFNIDNPCFKWTFSVKLINKRDWAAWSALGRGYTPNNAVNADHTSWSYYEMDNNNSTFTGIECHNGESILLTHRPSNLEFGFQVGLGANLKNGDFGISGGYDFTGDYTGQGDFNGTLHNCTEVDDPKVSFGNFVFEDINGNGIQESGEPGIEGVQVSLTGTDFNGDAVNGIATTDVNGNYFISTPLPGIYKLAISQIPDGYAATALNQGGNESLDSDVLPNGECIASSSYGLGHSDNIDAGYYQFASAGDQVWEDQDGDGLWNGIEPGIEGVIVNLIGANGAGFPVNETTVTDSNGFYIFDDLAPGNYIMNFELDPAYEPTFLNTGDDDSIDNDVFPDFNTANFSLISGEIIDYIDAGFFLPVSFGVVSFDDINNSCIRELGEPLVENLLVHLYRHVSADSMELYLSKSTQSGGIVMFEDVPPGDYEMHIDETTMPDNYVFTPNPNAGSDDDMDSDVNAEGIIEGITKRSGDPEDLSFGIGVINQAILPVELLYFTANLYNSNKALLQWATASELDNSHFSIERSADGTNFEKIGVVGGQGNTNELTEYSFVDEYPLAGVNYYRLKQVDFSGDFDYSSIQAVSIKGEGVKSSTLYPNPTKGQTVLRVSEQYKEDASLIVTNSIGQVVRRMTFTAGANRKSIDLSELEAGIYYIQLEYQGRNQFTHSLIKL